MTNDSMFRIYSMSKPITGVAMMQLFEQGKWQLDDPISKYVPELGTLKVLTYDAAGKVVMKGGKPVLADPKSAPTMRQLMSHTAGFGYGLCCEDPVNAAFRDTGVLTSANLDEMMTKIEATSRCSVDPGTTLALLRLCRYPGLHRPEALRPEVRRLPQGQRLHAARHERHVLLRHRSQQAALHGRLSLGQGQEARS
jgi:CubicO group peptidase (beta-lactamase class C family)